MDKLNPESGGGGVENSEVDFTRGEAKANFEAFKTQIDGLHPKIDEDFKAIWEKMKILVETLIAKIPA